MKEVNISVLILRLVLIMTSVLFYQCLELFSLFSLSLSATGYFTVTLTDALH